MTLPGIVAIVLLAAVLGGLFSWLTMRSRATGLETSLKERTVRVDQLGSELLALRDEKTHLDRALTAERAARNVERRAEGEKVAALKDAQNQWLTEIDALSRRALDQNSKSFIGLARAQFEQLVTQADERGEQNRLKMEQMVLPLGKSLEAVQIHLSAVEKDRTEAYASLSQQVRGLSEAQLQLQKEASNLVNALRKPAVRGRWGEVQLRRVVEMAGMLPYCDFEEQHTVNTDQGRMRPDLIVRLPGDRIIVVDAKVPLEAYLEYIEVEDEHEKKSHMARHVSQIKEHIRKLGAKAYFDQFPTTPDLVVMFLPGESFYYAAMQADATLFEYGIDNNVIVATPMTLIALLRAVAFGWRQERVAENARQISTLGQELYDRICILADRFSKVGTGLNSAVKNYNRAVGTMESRVLVSARRFKELGTGSSKELPVVEKVDEIPRTLTADLFGSGTPKLTLGGDGGDLVDTEP